MAKDLLFEIGTEEVPAHVMPGTLAQLKENAEKAFKENRIAFKAVRTLGTPRRTALLVEGLAEKQEDVASENRGPSVKIAFDAEGNPTKAAQGFARGQQNRRGLGPFFYPFSAGARPCKSLCFLLYFSYRIRVSFSHKKIFSTSAGWCRT